MRVRVQNHQTNSHSEGRQNLGRRNMKVKGAKPLCEDSFTLAPLLKVFENIIYLIYTEIGKGAGCKRARVQGNRYCLGCTLPWSKKGGIAEERR